MIKYTWSCLHSILPTILLNPPPKKTKRSKVLAEFILCRTGGIANVALTGMSEKGKKKQHIFHRTENEVI